MAITETVKVAYVDELDRVSNVILGELKAECPKRSGAAAGSVNIENVGEFARSIGSSHPHFFFADQGNNQTRSVIYPVRKKALKFTDGSVHGSASTYNGKHFVKAVADRHR